MRYLINYIPWKSGVLITYCFINKRWGVMNNYGCQVLAHIYHTSDTAIAAFANLQDWRYRSSKGKFL